MSPNIWATFEENIVVENCHKSPSQVTLGSAATHLTNWNCIFCTSRSTFRQARTFSNAATYLSIHEMHQWSNTPPLYFLSTRIFELTACLVETLFI